MAANPLRGEVALLLDGQMWRLRPSFERLVAAEAELGSLFALLERVGAGDVRLGEVEGLFWCCLDGERPERAEFRAWLAEAGMTALLPPYRQLLAQVFTGG